MSRAFVSEEDSSPEQDAPEIKIPLPPGAKNYVTPAGAARLREELGRLDREERPRLAAEIGRRGRDQDGGSEDPEGARRRLREVLRRIEYLNRMLARMQIVEPEAAAGGEAGRRPVQFGVPVAVRGSDGAREVFRIVGVDESDPPRGLISWISPLARALTGAGEGDRVEVDLPEGRAVLEILSVGPDPAAEELEKKSEAH